MQYLLMAYVNESGWAEMPPDQQQQAMGAYHAYMEALTQAGALVGSNRLQGSATATRVQVVGGKPQVLDGPYADSKEQLGGYFLVEAPDLDAAISWAARCPASHHGLVEVRPVWPMAAA